jgi:hypothetical protein
MFFLEKSRMIIKQTNHLMYDRVLVCRTLHLILLSSNSWKSKKLETDWFNDEANVRQTVGLSIFPSSSSSSSSSSTSSPVDDALSASYLFPRSQVTRSSQADRPLSGKLVQCQTAYCDEVPIEQARALGCGHYFCGKRIEFI